MTALIFTRHLEVDGSSDKYISRQLDGAAVPVGVSFDMIAKTASRIERMVSVVMAPRKPWKEKTRRES